MMDLTQVLLFIQSYIEQQAAGYEIASSNCDTSNIADQRYDLSERYYRLVQGCADSYCHR